MLVNADEITKPDGRSSDTQCKIRKIVLKKHQRFVGSCFTDLRQNWCPSKQFTELVLSRCLMRRNINAARGFLTKNESNSVGFVFDGFRFLSTMAVGVGEYKKAKNMGLIKITCLGMILSCVLHFGTFF